MTCTGLCTSDAAREVSCLDLSSRRNLGFSCEQPAKSPDVALLGFAKHPSQDPSPPGQPPASERVWQGMRVCHFCPVRDSWMSSSTGLADAVRSASQSEARPLYSASFCLCSPTCQMCIMAHPQAFPDESCFSSLYLSQELPPGNISQLNSASASAQLVTRQQQFRFHCIHGMCPFSNFHFFC